MDLRGVENINLSSIVTSHADYLYKMDEILELINLHA